MNIKVCDKCKKSSEELEGTYVSFSWGVFSYVAADQSESGFVEKKYDLCPPCTIAFVKAYFARR